MKKSNLKDGQELPIVLIVVFLFFLVSLICAGCAPSQYVTTSVENYGQYIGNYDNKTVQAFITSFFPEKIEDYFANITYSYRAEKADSYAFEAYLSFNVEDEVVYNSVVETFTAGLKQSVFRYDNKYYEYVLVDEFLPNSEVNYDGYIHIRYAKIGKILCNPEKQEIIFVALGVYDGGVAKTNFLTVYFDRFDINPREYAEHAIPSYILNHNEG